MALVHGQTVVHASVIRCSVDVDVLGHLNEHVGYKRTGAFTIGEFPSIAPGFSLPFKQRTSHTFVMTLPQFCWCDDDATALLGKHFQNNLGIWRLKGDVFDFDRRNLSCCCQVLLFYTFLDDFFGKLASH